MSWEMKYDENVKQNKKKYIDVVKRPNDENDIRINTIVPVKRRWKYRLLVWRWRIAYIVKSLQFIIINK